MGVADRLLLALMGLTALVVLHAAQARADHPQLSEMIMVEAQVGESIDAFTSKELRQKLRQIQQQRADCTSDCLKLLQHERNIEARLLKCESELGLSRSLAGMGQFPALEHMAEKCVCCEARSVVKVCVASGSPRSDACRCLNDDQCIEQTAHADISCASKFEAAKTDAVAKLRLSLLSDYRRENPECAQAQEVTQAITDLCRTKAEALTSSNDATALQAYVTGMAECPQVVEIQKRLEVLHQETRQRCSVAWIWALGSGYAAEIRAFAREQPACPQAAKAESEARRIECRAAWAPLQSSNDIRAVFAFLRNNRQCANEADQAAARLDELAQSCMSDAERAGVRSVDQGMAAYRECLSRFAQSPRHISQIESAIAGLETNEKERQRQLAEAEAERQRLAEEERQQQLAAAERQRVAEEERQRQLAEAEAERALGSVTQASNSDAFFPAGGGWTVYENARFGTTLAYPSTVFEVLDPPQSGNGRRLEARSGDAQIEINAWNDPTPNALQSLRRRLMNTAGYEQVTYKPTGGNWFVLSGLRGRNILRKVST